MYYGLSPRKSSVKGFNRLRQVRMRDGRKMCYKWRVAVLLLFVMNVGRWLGPLNKTSNCMQRISLANLISLQLARDNTRDGSRMTNPSFQI